MHLDKLEAVKKDYTDVTGIVQKCNLQKFAERMKDIIVLGNKIAEFDQSWGLLGKYGPFCIKSAYSGYAEPRIFCGWP